MKCSLEDPQRSIDFSSVLNPVSLDCAIQALLQRRNNPMTQRQIERWFRSTPRASIGNSLIMLVEQGNIVAARTSLGRRWVLEYSPAPRGGDERLSAPGAPKPGRRGKMLVTVLRLTDARTRRALMAEIARADSMDGGTRERWGGMCVGLLAGQSYRPHRPSISGWVVRWDDDCEYTPTSLRAYFATQGRRRAALWQFAVAETDIIGYSYRIQGGASRVVLLDGLVIRPGASITHLRRLR